MQTLTDFLPHKQKEQTKKQVAYEDNMCNARCIQSNGKI